MRVATTVHKAGFDQYAHRWVEGIKNWPKDAEFWMYAEGFSVPDAAIADFEVVPKRCEDLPRLREFKARHAGYVSPSWEFDIVRFSNKVFAAYDAFYDYDGLCVWLDADCVTYEKLPEGFIEGLLKDSFMGLYKRAGLHTETGFWVMDGKHPEKQAFLDTWIQWFETDQFKTLHQWHDCTTLDATVKLFEKEGRFKTENLSGAHFKDPHPIVKSDLGKYIDHRKGPRKSLDFSPENSHAKLHKTKLAK